MPTMLSIAKKWVPDGCELVLVKEKASQYHVKVVLDGVEGVTWIPKQTAPGYSTKVAKQSIATAMMSIFLQTGEVEKAKEWQGKLLNPKEWKERGKP